MKQSNNKKSRDVTAFLYERLSRDDNLEGESYSIGNQYVICNRMAVVPVLFCGGGNRALVTRPVQFYDLMVFHCALPSFCVKAFHLYRQQK